MARNAAARSLSEPCTPPPAGNAAEDSALLDQLKSSSPAADSATTPATKADTLTTPVSKVKGTVATTPLSASAKKKLALLDASWGVTPYPNFARPSPEECQEVHDLLSTVHGAPVRPKVLVDKANAAAGCGEVPSVLDALVRTLLSQNTTSRNSTAAKNAMDEAYGRAAYREVLEGGEEKLATTITCGGLAKVKAKAIIKILERIDEREGGKGDLSLDYLHEMDDKSAMEELCSFDLVGVKTASCVLLFCLGRDSFAVDTHVHRLSLSLGWLPPSATRDTAFYHLDVRIPNELKYGLHSLLVRHGRGCAKCAANGVQSMDHVETCPIRGLVNSKGRKKGGKGKKVEDEEEVEIDVGEEHDGKVKVEEKVIKKSPATGRTTRTTRASKVLPVLGDAEDVKPEKVTKRKAKGSVADDEASMSGISPQKRVKKELPEGAMHGMDE